MVATQAPCDAQSLPWILQRSLDDSENCELQQKPPQIQTNSAFQVHEGLDVELTSSSKEPVVHWTCKECKFRSKAPKVEAQPDIVLFNQKYAIRYRWMFLAKSHRTAEVEW
jgi:hypothetical protein